MSGFEEWKMWFVGAKRLFSSDNYVDPNLSRIGITFCFPENFVPRGFLEVLREPLSEAGLTWDEYQNSLIHFDYQKSCMYRLNEHEELFRCITNVPFLTIEWYSLLGQSSMCNGIRLYHFWCVLDWVPFRCDPWTMNGTILRGFLGTEGYWVWDLQNLPPDHIYTNEKTLNQRMNAGYQDLVKLTVNGDVS